MTASELSTKLALVAGNGSLPLEVARAAQERGLDLEIIAHRGESSSDLEKFGKTTWIRLGQLGKLIRTLKRAGVNQVIFAGGISRVKLFGGGAVRPDLRAMRLLARLRSINDDILLRGIASELESAGLKVVSPATLLNECVPSSGVLTKRAPEQSEISDAILGWQTAKLIGSAEIGQTVVVSKGVVVAVEAVEGTDATIMRGGQLARAGAVVVKVAKPQQDLRLDLPTIGSKTIETLKSAAVKLLVLETGKCLIVEPVLVCELADKAGISILVVASEQELQQRLDPLANPSQDLARRYR